AIARFLSMEKFWITLFTRAVLHADHQSIRGARLSWIRGNSATVVVGFAVRLSLRTFHKLSNFTSFLWRVLETQNSKPGTFFFVFVFSGDVDFLQRCELHIFAVQHRHPLPCCHHSIFMDSNC